MSLRLWRQIVGIKHILEEGRPALGLANLLKGLFGLVYDLLVSKQNLLVRQVLGLLKLGLLEDLDCWWFEL